MTSNYGKLGVLLLNKTLSCTHAVYTLGETDHKQVDEKTIKPLNGLKRKKIGGGWPWLIGFGS